MYISATPKTFSLLAVALVLALVGMSTVRADCPDTGVRCQIPLVSVQDKISHRGCSISVGGSVYGTDGVAGGTVEVEGSCYQTFQDKEHSKYLYVGHISMGQCFQWWSLSCRPEQCSNNDPGDKCNEQLEACTVSSDDGRDSTYTVVAGDTCWDIADRNGMTVEKLQNLNGGDVDCDNLQINTELCLNRDCGKGTPMCEGTLV